MKDREFQLQGNKAIMVEDGEWFQFEKGKDGIMRHGCCDCGLVHRIEYRIVGNDVEFSVCKDNEATDELRKLRH